MVVDGNLHVPRRIVCRPVLQVSTRRTCSFATCPSHALCVMSVVQNSEARTKTLRLRPPKGNYFTIRGFEQATKLAAGLTTTFEVCRALLLAAPCPCLRARRSSPAYLPLCLLTCRWLVSMMTAVVPQPLHTHTCHPTDATLPLPVYLTDTRMGCLGARVQVCLPGDWSPQLLPFKSKCSYTPHPFRLAVFAQIHACTYIDTRTRTYAHPPKHTLIHLHIPPAHSSSLIRFPVHQVACPHGCLLSCSAG